MKLTLLATTLLLADVAPTCGDHRQRDAERVRHRELEQAREGARGELMTCLGEAPKTALSGPQAAAACIAAKIERSACRSAWSDLDGSPSATAAIAGACTAEYCDVLPYPRPQLCEAPGRELVSLEDLRLWTEFHAAVLAHDLAIRRPEQLAWLGAQLASTAPMESYAHRGPVNTSVRLPTATGEGPRPKRSAEPDTSLVVMLAADGALSVDGEPVDAADLEALIERTTQAAPESGLSMVLEAEATVPYAQVVAIMERAKAAGVQRISIAVEPKPPAPPVEPLR